MLTGGCGARPRTACECALFTANNVAKSPLDSADNFDGAGSGVPLGHQKFSDLFAKRRYGEEAVAVAEGPKDFAGFDRRSALGNRRRRRTASLGTKDLIFRCVEQESFGLYLFEIGQSAGRPGGESLVGFHKIKKVIGVGYLRPFGRDA
jgi:hypothetical protein